MNGIRSKTSTSPPLQVQGQSQQRNIVFPSFLAGTEEFQPSNFGQSSYPQPNPHSYPVQQIGVQSQSYEIGKPSYSAPRMPSPGLGQQQQASMYQPQAQQQGMRPNAPFFQPGQQNMNVRPQRYPSPAGNPQGMIYGTPQMISYLNQGQFGGQQPIIMNSSMIPTQRMPNPQYNAGIPSSTPGMFQLPPQQPISYSQGYGNQPLFMGSQPTSQRPPSTQGQVPQQYVKPKEKKHILSIVDPHSGKDVTAEILKTTNLTEVTASPDSGSRSTPVASTTEEHALQGVPTNEIAAQFAAQVAAKLGPGPPPIAGPTPVTVPLQQHVQPAQGIETPVVVAVSGEPAPLAGPAQHAPAYIPSPQQPVNVDTVIDSCKTHPSLSNGGPLPSEDTKPSEETCVSGPHIHSASNVEKAQETSEPVSVSVKSAPVIDRTNVSEVNCDSSSGRNMTQEVSREMTPDVGSEEIIPDVCSREMTPEVNIVPPTPVEKKPEMEIPVKCEEPVVEVSIPKKLKNKMKKRDLNNKGEQISGSEFDAYIDTTVPDKAEVEVAIVSTPELTTSSVLEVTTSNTLPVTTSNTLPVTTSNTLPVTTSNTLPVTTSNTLPVTTSTTLPVTTSNIPEETEPVAETPTQPIVPEETIPEKTTDSEIQSSTAADEIVPQVEIKVEDVPAETQELEEGEIVDDDEESEMMELRYKYSEDQWSPLNPEGKKHYDREFLLQFQNDQNAVQKPVGLPDIPDIILDKPQSMGRQFSREIVTGNQGSQDFIDFTPRYWGTGGGGGGGVGGVGGGGGSKSRGLPRQPSNQKMKSGPAPRQINVSISKDIELHKAKEAWKPGHSDGKKDDVVADAKTEELYKKTRSILNKLTPQKFQTLVSQMQALPIESENKLKLVIDLVFEKAIGEPSFSVAYANMCRCLSMFKVQSESKPGEMVNFRAVLLTRCQREFEKDKSSEALFQAKREEIEKAEEGAKKEELKHELQYEESKAKRRSLGNIRFIGELFKLKMLTENIMHDCVFKLLRTKDPENLECLCRLLTTIGKELDVDKAKPRMDQYFQQMGKIVGEKKTSSRVRFMLQDCMDLRTNKWIPRRVDNNPKTIDQIHKEVAQEAQEKALLSQQNLQQSRSIRGGARRGGPPNQMSGSDGWNMVGTSRTPLKSVDRSIDPSKMKLSKQNVDESAIQLGPGGGAGRFSGWGRGSTGGTSGRSSMEKEKDKPNVPTNRFSALGRSDEDSNRFGAVSPARGDSRGRGFGRPPSLGARQSQESERERAVAAAKAIGAGQSVEGGHRERSRGRTEPQPSHVEPSSKELKIASEAEMEKKTKAILDEYFAIQDMKEAVLCVQELSSQNHHHFIYNAINHVLERSSVARKQTGHILHDLVKQQVISVDNYIKGLVDVLEFAEDLEIDIPKIWQYYGELISPMIQDNSVPLSFLKEAAKPLIANNKAGILLAEILHDASHREGHKKIAGLWATSGLLWSDFVPKNQVEQFLIDKDLEFTNGGDSAPTTPTTGLPVQEVEVKLHELIVRDNADNEKVFDWIESNVDDPTTRRPKFIRALMTAVCNSAIKGDRGKERLEPKEISARNDLLQKYLDHQPESELQALYALQALIARLEHPQGVLRGMFDMLYDEDIISEDAFFQWEKSEEETEGKGVCLKQAVQFFTWLREAEEDS